MMKRLSAFILVFTFLASMLCSCTLNADPQYIPSNDTGSADADPTPDESDTAQDRIIDELNQTVGQLSSEVDELKGAVDELFKTNERLSSEVDELKGTVNEVFKTNERLTAENESLKSALEILDAQKYVDNLFLSVDSMLTNHPYAGSKVAFYYENIETGISYFYNPNEAIPCASIIKLPFALELLYRLEDMENDGLDDVFVYDPSFYVNGSGVIIGGESGDTYTYRELLRLMLYYSDNVAYDQLRKKYGGELVDVFSEKHGLTALSAKNAVLSAADCAAILHCTYDYIEGDYKYSSLVKETMLSSVHRVMICSSGKPTAHKYGWDKTAYGDIGICYADSPYFMAFLSDFSVDAGDGRGVNAYIGSIVHAVDSINTKLAERLKAGGE